MLRFLSIRNLAVIEAVDIDFEPGLNVLTGETGAGKSILVGAVGLLLGARSSADLVRTGEETAIVQAVFETVEGDEMIVRREVTAQGRSRAFVNGSLATAANLRDLAARLVDLHGQHEHQALLDPSTHIDVLDEYAGHDEARSELSQAFTKMRSIEQETARLRAAERDKLARSEFLAYQLQEIERVSPRAGEDEELLATRQLLANAERLQRLSAECYALLYEDDQAVLSSLGVLWRRLGDLATLDPRFGPHLATRDSIKPQLEDLAAMLRTYAADIDGSPERLHQIEERLAALERLKRKHGQSLSAVLACHAEFRRELDDLEMAGERIAELEAALRTATAGYLEAARKVSAGRRDVATRLARNLERQLGDLAMERTRFEVRFNTVELPETRWTERGIDEAEFYVSPNPGEDLRPLARVVSGGELSRVMLALKTLATTDMPGKTLVFDEVDAGIGGSVADAVGSKLQALGTRFQVLCITHLPQIAAYGSTHFRITKCFRQERTLTEVSRLKPSDRVEELARMIAGAGFSDGTRATARDLLLFRRPPAPGGESESEDNSKAKVTKRRGESESGARSNS
jgi:DNA repair protein RecN (Recombination protein N)